MKKCPSAPASLSPEAKNLWRRLLTEFDVNDQHGLLLLRTALEAMDRMRAAQAAIARDGVTIVDRWGQSKPHPACQIERDSRTGMLAALKALRLDIEPLHGAPGRPAGW